VALDHRAHGAIHDQDALGEQGFKEMELRYSHHIEIIPYWGVDGGEPRSGVDHRPGFTDTVAVHCPLWIDAGKLQPGFLRQSTHEIQILDRLTGSALA
jgi:hypothetical protein